MTERGPCVRHWCGPAVGGASMGSSFPGCSGIGPPTHGARSRCSGLARFSCASGSAVPSGCGTVVARRSWWPPASPRSSRR
eukprot:10039515-Lingulodinium_polyedra.AAC.1